MNKVTLHSYGTYHICTIIHFIQHLVKLYLKKKKKISGNVRKFVERIGPPQVARAGGGGLASLNVGKKSFLKGVVSSSAD